MRINAIIYEGHVRNNTMERGPRSALPATPVTDAENTLAAHGLAPPEKADSAPAIARLDQPESTTNHVEEPFTREQVLLQAGGTVLGNANQIPELVISLLRG